MIAASVKRLLILGLLAATVAAGPAAPGVLPFDGNSGWLNSGPLTPNDLRGKVVLVDFWEYTCVNCLRTLPYLKAWNERYKNDGFVIIGVHTPEFGFSGERGNVAAADTHLGVTWPVVLDTNGTIWQRYKNDGWPHEFLFDQNGELVDSVSGEGDYQNTEAKIQHLLRAANPQVSLPPVMALLPQDSYEKPGARCYLRTPELLVAHTKIGDQSSFGNPARDLLYTDKVDPHTDGALYLQGLWHMAHDAAVSGGLPAYASMRYHAIQVVTVLAPGDDGRAVRVDVTQDGLPVAKSDAGSDIRYDAAGKSYLQVDAPRAYDVIMNAKFDQHELRLTPAGYGLGVFSYAFESCEVPG